MRTIWGAPRHRSAVATYAVLTVALLGVVALLLVTVTLSAGGTIIIDGDFSDWSSVPQYDVSPHPVEPTGDVHGTSNNDLDLVDIYVTDDASYLYFKYNVLGTMSESTYKYEVFLDTDKNTPTGYRGPDGTWSWGADYMVENNNLYAYGGSGTDWNWNSADSGFARAIGGGNTVEIRVPRSTIGETGSSDELDFAIRTVDNPQNPANWDLYPEALYIFLVSFTAPAPTATPTCCDYLDGWYCNGDIKEYRDYYCSDGSCNYTVTQSADCNDSDYYSDWVDYCVGDEVWSFRYYFDYKCQNGTCVYDGKYIVDNHKVVDCNIFDEPGTPGKDYSCSDGQCVWVTLVALVSLTARGYDGYALVEWETASEVDTEGFNIWRSEAEDGQYIKLNEALIPPQGSPITGASYSYIDDTVTNGVTYYYKLEDVDTYAVSTFHGPVSATPSRVFRTFVPLVIKGP